MNRARIAWVSALMVYTLVACGPSAGVPQPSASASPAGTASSAATAAATARPQLHAKAALGGSVLGSSNFVPIHLAIAKKYFEAEGLTIEWIQANSAPLAMAAVLAGDVDFAVGGLSAVVSAVQQGQDVKAFAPVGVLAQTLVVNNDILRQRNVSASSPLADKVRSLKGLKIGTSGPGSTIDLSMRYILIQQGMNPDRDVELVALKAETQVAAFDTGRTDASLTTSTGVAQIVATGKGSEFIGYQEIPVLAALLGQVLYAKSSVMTQKPGVMAAATLALARALRDLKSDPAGAKDILRATPEYRSMTPQLWETNWASYQVQSSAYPPTAVMTEDQIFSVVRLTNLVNKTNIQFTFDQLATNRFAQEARSTLGN